MEVGRILKVKKDKMTIKAEKVARRLQRVLDETAEALPEGVRKAFRAHAFLAGGCVWSEFNKRKPNDYDVFFDDKDALDKVCNWLEAEEADPQSPLVLSTDNALTLKVGKKAVQIVRGWWGEPYAVISQFDFMHNMFAVKDGVMIPGADLFSLSASCLAANPKNVGNMAKVLIRVPKMIAKGLSFGAEGMASLLEMVVAQDPELTKSAIDGASVGGAYSDDALDQRAIDEAKGTYDGGL